MALFADDVERLRFLADYLIFPDPTHRSFLLDLSTRILNEIAEPDPYPWPGPDDEPSDPSDAGSYRERP